MKKEYPKQIRFIHKQNFRGEILQDSFVKTIFDEIEKDKTIKNLYTDSHVFEVRYEEVGSSKQ